METEENTVFVLDLNEYVNQQNFLKDPNNIRKKKTRRKKNK